MERFRYKEAGPQLLLQAFLQRILNAGGRIEREYGLGRRRTDLLVLWPIKADEPVFQKTVIELKIRYKALRLQLRMAWNKRPIIWINAVPVKAIW